MSKGMTAFWSFMVEKGYGGVDNDGDPFINGPCGWKIFQFVLQMLEGYMREFLEESGWKYGVSFIHEEASWRNPNSPTVIWAGPYDYEKVIEEAFK